MADRSETSRDEAPDGERGEAPAPGAFRAARWQRICDVVLSSTGLVVLSPLMAGVCVVGLADTGSPIFSQVRAGRDQKPFVLYKFRTMKPGTASVATHLAQKASITRWGRILRRTKLDELPQLWCVLKGDMSLVGPRPGLFNQEALTEARRAWGVFAARPGITGLAQIQGIDMSTPEILAETDAKMLAGFTPAAYASYIVKTALGKGRGDRVVR